MGEEGKGLVMKLIVVGGSLLGVNYFYPGMLAGLMGGVGGSMTPLLGIGGVGLIAYQNHWSQSHVGRSAERLSRPVASVLKEVGGGLTEKSGKWFLKTLRRSEKADKGAAKEARDDKDSGGDSKAEKDEGKTRLKEVQDLAQEEQNQAAALLQTAAIGAEESKIAKTTLKALKHDEERDEKEKRDEEEIISVFEKFRGLFTLAKKVPRDQLQGQIKSILATFSEKLKDLLAEHHDRIKGDKEVEGTATKMMRFMREAMENLRHIINNSKKVAKRLKKKGKSSVHHVEKRMKGNYKKIRAISKQLSRAKLEQEKKILMKQREEVYRQIQFDREEIAKLKELEGFLKLTLNNFRKANARLQVPLKNMKKARREAWRKLQGMKVQQARLGLQLKRDSKKANAKITSMEKLNEKDQLITFFGAITTSIILTGTAGLNFVDREEKNAERMKSMMQSLEKIPKLEVQVVSALDYLRQALDRIDNAFIKLETLVRQVLAFSTIGAVSDHKNAMDLSKKALEDLEAQSKVIAKVESKEFQFLSNVDKTLKDAEGEIDLTIKNLGRRRGDIKRFMTNTTKSFNTVMREEEKGGFLAKRENLHKHVVQLIDEAVDQERFALKDTDKAIREEKRPAA